MTADNSLSITGFTSAFISSYLSAFIGGCNFFELLSRPPNSAQPRPPPPGGGGGGGGAGDTEKAALILSFSRGEKERHSRRRAHYLATGSVTLVNSRF